MGLEGILKYYHIFKSDGGEVSRGAREEVNDGLERNQDASSIMGVEQSDEEKVWSMAWNSAYDRIRTHSWNMEHVS